MSEFYSKLMKLAFPIALQSLIISSINMVDVFMVGKLGQVEIAAPGAFKPDNVPFHSFPVRNQQRKRYFYGTVFRERR